MAKQAEYYLVAAKVNDKIVDAGAYEGDHRCLGDGVLVDGRALAQPGVENGEPGSGVLILPVMMKVVTTMEKMLQFAGCRLQGMADLMNTVPIRPPNVPMTTKGRISNHFH